MGDAFGVCRGVGGEQMERDGGVSTCMDTMTRERKSRQRERKE